MNKVGLWAASALAAVLLVCGVSLYYTSTLFDEGLRKSVANLNTQFRSPELQLQFSLTGDSSLLSADYQLIILVEESEISPIDGEEVALNIHADYLPFIANYMATLAGGDLKAELRAAMNNTPEPLTIDVTGFFNPISQQLSTNGSLRIAEVDTIVDKRVDVTLAETGLDFEHQGDTLISKLQAGPFKASEGSVVLSLNRLFAETTARTSKDFTSFSLPESAESALILEQFYLIDRHGEGLSFDKFGITSEQYRQDTSMIMDTVLTLDEMVELADQKSIPNIEKLTANLSVGAGLQSMIKVSGLVDNLTPQQKQNPLLAVGILDEMLAEGVDLTVNELSLVSDGGNAKATLDARLHPIKVMEAILTPDAAVEKVVAQGQISFDSQLSNYLPLRTQILLVDFANQGFLSTENDQFSSSFDLRKGKLVVNDINVN
ncbi:MAG: DUF945 family protein [Pontibacterium sp.]